MKLKDALKLAAWTVASAMCFCACSKATVPTSSKGGGSGSDDSGEINTCTTSVLDSGQKGIVTAVGRGVYSDTAVIPGTRYPATAYADPGAVTLKLTYWDGSAFATEVISGDGAGTFVRLAFLSTGVPIVLWAQGGNLKAAIRSTSLTSTAVGTWNAGIIDIGTAPRAIEVSVNPLDQVAVSFLTDTAVVGRPKFLYCNSPCTSPSNFQTMVPNAFIENTNLIAAQTGTGVGWCKSSSTVYYPAVVYSVTGIVRYAVCQSSLSNCVNSSNWTTQTVVATGNLASKLKLDANVVGDVPKVVSLGASGLVTYRMGSTACTAAPASFTAGSTIGTATTGTQWFALLKDTSDMFHIVANESTTSIRYFNSTTTDINGAWNTQGTVDTTTLAAANGGGADISSSNDIYLSYGQNVAPFDIRAARVIDSSVASNSASFAKFNIDLSGGLQLTAANSQQRNVSAAASSSGRPAVAYIDFSIGAAAGARLKYAYRAGSSSGDLWDISMVPGTSSPQFPSLAFDKENKPWISYFEAGSNRWFLTSNTRTDGLGNWRTYEFPVVSSGAPAALPAANGTTLSMLYSGGVAYPVMVVIDSNAGSKGLKAAMLTPSTGVWSGVVTVDALTGASSAASVSSDFDTASATVVIAYYELNSNRAKYSVTTDGNTWSTPINVSSVNQGPGVAVKLNPKTGSPAISYYDRSNNTVYYATCSGSPTACATSGFTPSSIDMAAGVSGLVAGNEQLLSTGVVFNSSGTAQVIYPRGQGSTGDLTLASNGSGSFVISRLASGINGSLAGTVALNFGVAGWNASSIINAAGGIFSAFIGPGNWLYATSCKD